MAWMILNVALVCGMTGAGTKAMSKILRHPTLYASYYKSNNNAKN